MNALAQRSYLRYIVVLAGGVSLDGELPRHVISRLDRAITLFHQSPTISFILSGRYSFLFPKHEQPPITEARRMEQYLLERGILKKYIIKEVYSRDTISNAYFLKKLIFIPRRIDASYVITSTFHLPRVKYIFQKVFGASYRFNYIGVPEKLSREKVKQVMRHQKQMLSKTRVFLDQMLDGQHEYLRGKFFRTAYYTESRPAWVINFIARGE